MEATTWLLKQIDWLNDSIKDHAEKVKLGMNYSEGFKEELIKEINRKKSIRMYLQNCLNRLDCEYDFLN